MSEMMNVDQEVAIEDELAKDLKDFDLFGSLIRRVQFDLDLIATDELQKLRDAVRQEHKLADYDQGYPSIYYYKIEGADSERTFLQLFIESNLFYVRHGYKELWNQIKCKWNDKFPRVVLLGNAGTGKSWFQIYVLKELLHAKAGEVRWVIRQVGDSFALMDVLNCKVYEVLCSSEKRLLEVIRKLNRIVYLFEPGGKKELEPLILNATPSLVTLSPYNSRIQEYRKGPSAKLYFWPWSYAELEAVMSLEGRDEMNLPILFYWWGGIVRHVLDRNQESLEMELPAKLRGMTLEKVGSMNLNIDRDDSKDGNVSGHILCYNSPIPGQQSFSKYFLQFTSAKVEELLEKVLHQRPAVEQAQLVQRRLRREMEDRGGIALESFMFYVLSLGRDGFKWTSTEINDHGSQPQQPFVQTDTKKEQLRNRTVHEHLNDRDKILASTNASFPGVDIVFSRSGSAEEVHAVQCTWAQTHPFTVRSLYRLRAMELKIESDTVLHVYYVVPTCEKDYQGRKKADYMKSILDKPLQYTKTIAVPVEELHKMWESTRIYVLCPSEPWEKIVSEVATGTK